ncbi:MAG TPA: hypothetical protein DCS19_09595 [Flavobacterium sp.]|nr:hypothetical protein [Flavobacterium sp.]
MIETNIFVVLFMLLIVIICMVIIGKVSGTNHYFASRHRALDDEIDSIFAKRKLDIDNYNKSQIVDSNKIKEPTKVDYFNNGRDFE